MIFGLVLAATACGGSFDSGNNSGKDSGSSSVSASVDSEVSGGVTVSEKEKTLRVGEKYKINAKGNGLTFVSSDVSVASVSDDGTVTAISDGTTFITVSNKNDSVTCRIDVIKSDDYIRLDKTETGVVTGGEVTIKAEIIRNGKVLDDNISFTPSDEALKIMQSGNVITVTSDVVGYYTVTASYRDLTAKTVIKVVAANAELLGTPTLTTDNCETLKWGAISFADGYKIIVNGTDSFTEKGTAFDISDYTKDLKSGETVVFTVNAVAEGGFDHFDGLPARLVFAHDYKEEIIEPFTCVKAGKVNYSCENCGKTYEQDGVLASHKIKNGACEVCGLIVTERVLYLYDSTNECYYVGGADAGFDAEEVYILATYDDGKNGTHPVRYFGVNAFKDNDIIKKVVIPAAITEFKDKCGAYNNINKNGEMLSSPLRGGAFDGCTNLEFVSMEGVTYLPAIDSAVICDKDGNFKRIGGKDNMTEEEIADGCTAENIEYYHDNFRDCYKLTTVVVGDGFDNVGRSWMSWLNTPAGETGKADLYVKGEVKSLASDSYPLGSPKDANNNLLSGDVFRYDETSDKCFTWHYDNDGNVVSNGKHDYRNGVCRKCYAWTDYGINYGYDSANECYYVNDNKITTKTEIEILAEFDDGVNGVHPVTYIRNSAFKNNLNIRKIILPESIKRLEGDVFLNCTALEYISMTGIADMTFENLGTSGIYAGETEDVITNNNFLNCFALKTVIVGKNFNLYPSPDAQQFIGLGSFTACTDIYVDGGYEESNVSCEPNGRNNLLTGVVFYKGEFNTCRRWNIDESGEITTFGREHTIVNHKCSICGVYESNGVMYGYDGENKVYYVTGYIGSSTEVEVYEKYDDGKNGEHPVTFVKNSAFAENQSITKVILPTSVTRLDGAVFLNCGNLRYVSMLGIENMVFANIKVPYSDSVVTTNNNFLGCTKLTVLVVGEKFNLHPNGGDEQQFPKLGNSPCVDIYVYGKSVVDCSIGDDAKNGLLTGNVYYYSETNADNCWRYVNGQAKKW